MSPRTVGHHGGRRLCLDMLCCLLCRHSTQLFQHSWTATRNSGPMRSALYSLNRNRYYLALFSCMPCLRGRMLTHYAFSLFYSQVVGFGGFVLGSSLHSCNNFVLFATVSRAVRYTLLLRFEAVSKGDLPCLLCLCHRVCCTALGKRHELHGTGRHLRRLLARA